MGDGTRTSSLLFSSERGFNYSLPGGPNGGTSFFRGLLAASLRPTCGLLAACRGGVRLTERILSASFWCCFLLFCVGRIFGRLDIAFEATCRQSVPQISSCRNMPLHHDMSSCYDMSSCHDIASCHDVSSCHGMTCLLYTSPSPRD